MAKASSPVRVLLVEDHPIVRQGVRSLLETYSNLEVVGEAHDGEEAVAKVAKLQPAVVVMDINMPKMDGVAATRLIRTNYLHIAVLGLSVNAEGYHHDAMLRAGAFEVLSKEHAVDLLYSAIQRAVASIQPILIQEEPVETGRSDETPMNESATRERET
jgi:DNA-binding NarL/FixJ family response regulator